MKPMKLLPYLVLCFVLTANAALVNVSADTLAKWITVGTTFDFILIDVRDTSEATSIIAADACRPYHLSWNQGAFAGTMSKLPKTANIVLYCASGNRSGKAGQLLVDSGYVSVYSLSGGFNGWGTRPTKTYASVKAIAELPAPSMVKSSVRVAAAHSGSDRLFNMTVASGSLVITAPVSESHRVFIFNMQGRQVAVIQNPFASRTVFALPASLSQETRLASLRIGERQRGTVRISGPHQ
jgi:rhodanese-related sulfurtransferase